ncbi:hypothetical protein BX666DRAFT_829050 [Dichotomocladium elegans]|nr:hypothetical protein BX666DRAFT_829050 [Dichotomocladium elegans]
MTCSSIAMTTPVSSVVIALSFLRSLAIDDVLAGSETNKKKREEKREILNFVDFRSLFLFGLCPNLSIGRRTPIKTCATLWIMIRFLVPDLNDKWQHNMTNIAAPANHIWSLYPSC